MRALPILGVAAALVAVAPAVAGEATAQHRAGARLRQVDYAVDGDTLRVEFAGGELVYVRLVGIDTPEDVRPGMPVECGSNAAAASMRGLPRRRRSHPPVVGQFESGALAPLNRSR
jgi:endonuclease YncB( thermonuclease family)